MPVTALYTSILTILAFVLAQHVIKTRARTTIPLGDRGDDRLLEASRRQMNFVENVPLTVILMLLAEAGGAAATHLHIAGAVLVAARIVHPFGISVDRAAHPLRIGGAVTTNLVQLGLIVLLMMQHFA
jgi:uncharacterized membrane protein YecN with MAPEG domain